MQYTTFGDFKTKVEAELDLEPEEFVQPAEFVGYVNDGVSIAEAEIHKLGIEDEYFLTKSRKSIASGTEDIVLPTNLYASKIRKVIYKNGATLYEIKRSRSLNMFIDRELTNLVQQGGNTIYEYIIRNDSGAAPPVMELSPIPAETVVNGIIIYHIRKANVWSFSLDPDGAGSIDLPEIALQYLQTYVRWRCLSKEGHPSIPEAKVEMDDAKKLMVETLTNMVPDGESKIDQDTDIYDEMA